MKKTLFLAAVAALFTFTSCQREESSQTNIGGDIVFTASIAGQDTKTTVNAATGKVSWVLEDEVTITDNASTSVKYVVSSIDGTTGKATFTKKNGESGSLGAGPYKAVYGTAPDSVQTYSASVPTLPMNAESTTTDLTFTVTCGLLQLTVTASSEETVKEVRQIDVKGIPDGGTETVYTLRCSTPQSISSGGVFYIALPAGNYTKVYVTNSDYLCDTTKTSSVAISANTITPKTISGMKFKYAKDICCKVYPIVKIGDQIWTAENLKCDKYDTESEAYCASWLTDNTIRKAKPTIAKSFKDTASTPYYTDGTNKDLWTTLPSAVTMQSYVPDSVAAKLGYLYNWAAAVGIQAGYSTTSIAGYDKCKSKKGVDYWIPPTFTGNRQGICPNGWHVPTQAEIEALITFIEVTDGKGKETAGKHLRTKSGWNKDNNGLDTYGFGLVPVGFAQGDTISQVAQTGTLITASRATSLDSLIFDFKYYNANYLKANLKYFNGAQKSYARGGLRCIKNE